MCESLTTDREGYTKHVASSSNDKTEEEADSPSLLVDFDLPQFFDELKRWSEKEK